MKYTIVKSFFDKVFCIFLLILVFPFLVLIGISIYIKIGNPIFFKQERPGFKRKSFTLIKFRTMSLKKDKFGELLPDEERLNNFGKLLRKFSLDELPSLINILKGDMSFIGPRPLLIEYLPLYNEFQNKRHNVKPGFSGWAQIKGRNMISWDKRFELDIWYVDNQNFFLDLKIFFITIWKTIFSEGVTTKEGKTMSPFKGNKIL
tara:strand:- start:545 stop:1156 length:612 start_codon:yes stop_codon:yes gene_type:complete